MNQTRQNGGFFFSFLEIVETNEFLSKLYKYYYVCIDHSIHEIHGRIHSRSPQNLSKACLSRYKQYKLETTLPFVKIVVSKKCIACPRTIKRDY